MHGAVPLFNHFHDSIISLCPHLLNNGLSKSLCSSTTWLKNDENLAQITSPFSSVCQTQMSSPPDLDKADTQCMAKWIIKGTVQQNTVYAQYFALWPILSCRPSPAMTISLCSFTFFINAAWYFFQWRWIDGNNFSYKIFNYSIGQGWAKYHDVYRDKEINYWSASHWWIPIFCFQFNESQFAKVQQNKSSFQCLQKQS